MAYYLKGIGDMEAGINEIPPSLDARINKFMLGHISGVIRSEFNEFSAYTIDRGVVVKNGLMQAQGYFGCSDAETQLNYIMPGTTNYSHIYAEIDLSVVPNKFTIKATPMINTQEHTFRQDNLRAITIGIYQMPLWEVKLTASEITLTDKRTLISKPSAVLHAEEADHAINADQAAKAVNASSAENAVRVNDNAASSSTVAEFYVGNKLIRIET